MSGVIDQSNLRSSQLQQKYLVVEKRGHENLNVTKLNEGKRPQISTKNLLMTVAIQTRFRSTIK